MISKLSLAKNVMAYAGKIGSQIKPSSSIAQHSPSLKTLQKDTFCHQYWQQIKSEGLLKNSNQTSVKLHGYLNGINHHWLQAQVLRIWIKNLCHWGLLREI